MVHAMRCMLVAGYKAGALAIIHQSGSPPRPCAGACLVAEGLLNSERMPGKLLVKLLSANCLGVTASTTALRLETALKNKSVTPKQIVSLSKPR